MKPLLPGAMELPDDKYRFRIDELEAENATLIEEKALSASSGCHFSAVVIKQIPAA
ncbi:MAG: hypothetical protein LIP12_04335 [Clostridiales bacterium]|nr:hypothetical protein [Clostridiales bacterium]